MNKMSPEGIFKDRGTYYAKPVKILYKDGTAGGDAFSTIKIETDKGGAEFVVAGLEKLNLVTLDNLKEIADYFNFNINEEGQVPDNEKNKKEKEFIFYDKKYKLIREYKTYSVEYGTGEKYNEMMYIYYLETEKDGKIIKQLFQYSVGPYSNPVEWIGDMDDDKKIDIVIDYNEVAWGEKGLYLSSYSDKDKLIKKMDSSSTWSMN